MGRGDDFSVVGWELLHFPPPKRCQNSFQIESRLDFEKISQGFLHIEGCLTGRAMKIPIEKSTRKIRKRFCVSVGWGQRKKRSTNSCHFGDCSEVRKWILVAQIWKEISWIKIVITIETGVLGTAKLSVPLFEGDYVFSLRSGIVIWFPCNSSMFQILLTTLP